MPRHRADKVPADCWRMGPLHLGMTGVQLRTLLGKPDASQNLATTYRRRKYPVTQLFYVYPRNLKNWLRLAPARQTDFHPVTLQLSLFKDAGGGDLRGHGGARRGAGLHSAHSGACLCPRGR